MMRASSFFVVVMASFAIAHASLLASSDQYIEAQQQLFPTKKEPQHGLGEEVCFTDDGSEHDELCLLQGKLRTQDPTFSALQKAVAENEKQRHGGVLGTALEGLAGSKEAETQERTKSGDPELMAQLGISSTSIDHYAKYPIDYSDPYDDNAAYQIDVQVSGEVPLPRRSSRTPGTRYSFYKKYNEFRDLKEQLKKIVQAVKAELIAEFGEAQPLTELTEIENQIERGFPPKKLFKDPSLGMGGAYVPGMERKLAQTRVPALDIWLQNIMGMDSEALEEATVAAGQHRRVGEGMIHKLAERAQHATDQMLDTLKDFLRA